MKIGIILLLSLLTVTSLTAQVQGVSDVTLIQDPPNGPSIVVSPPGTLNPFSTVVGNNSGDQTFSFTATHLTGSVVWTAGTGMQVSPDGLAWGPTATFTQSGGNSLGTVHNRIASATAIGVYNGFVTSASAGVSSPPQVAYNATVLGVPSLSLSPTTITGLNSTTGTAGTPQTTTATFANIVGNVTATPFTPIEISIDGGSTWSAAALTFSTGSPRAVQLRDAASASPGAVSGNLDFSASGVSTVHVGVTGTVSPIAVLDSGNFNMDTTLLVTTNNFTNLTGDPHFRVLSGTDAISGVTLTTGPIANWNPFGGACAFPANGAGNYLPWAPNAAKEIWYSSNGGASNFDQYNVGFPKWVLSNLMPGHHYTLTFYSAYTFALNGNTEYRVNNGTTTYGPAILQGLNYTGTTGVSITGILSDGSGHANVYMNAASGQDIGSIGVIHYQRTD